jgi:hypothetical protein
MAATQAAPRPLHPAQSQTSLQLAQQEAAAVTMTPRGPPQAAICEAARLEMRLAPRHPEVKSPHRGERQLVLVDFTSLLLRHFPRSVWGGRWVNCLHPSGLQSGQHRSHQRLGLQQLSQCKCSSCNCWSRQVGGSPSRGHRHAVKSTGSTASESVTSSTSAEAAAASGGRCPDQSQSLASGSLHSPCNRATPAFAGTKTRSCRRAPMA